MHKKTLKSKQKKRKRFHSIISHNLHIVRLSKEQLPPLMSQLGQHNFKIKAQAQINLQTSDCCMELSI